jgi:LacI family transcriptional regulator
MVGLKDVAIACGLSVTQVSRALNDHNDVSAQTKQRVREIADKLGYVKNINAQILATKASNQIAVMIHGIDKDKNSEPSIIFNIMKGINHFAKENRYEAVVHLNEDPDLSYLNFCKQRGITGIILFGINYEDNNFKEIIASDFPCVVIDIPVEGKNKGCVVVNNTYFSIIATNHIIQRGRKKIAMLCGHGHSMVDVERRMGYEMALRKNNMTVDESIIIKADFDSSIAFEKTLELFEKHPDVDGIYCASDFMALGAINALKQIGKRLPEEVSIFGFDGILMGEFSTPKLCTIKQDNLKKGYAAAKLLCDILDKKEENRTVVVPCDVVLRESI